MNLNGILIYNLHMIQVLFCFQQKLMQHNSNEIQSQKNTLLINLQHQQHQQNT